MPQMNPQFINKAWWTWSLAGWIDRSSGGRVVGLF